MKQVICWTRESNEDYILKSPVNLLICSYMIIFIADVVFEELPVLIGQLKKILTNGES